MLKKYAEFPPPQWTYSKSDSEPLRLWVLARVAHIVILAGSITFSACNSDGKKRQPTISKQPYAVAADAVDAGFAAIHNGNVPRAIDQWGKAATIFEGIEGTENDQASCLLNRGLALATVGRHEEAVEDLGKARSVLESIRNEGKTYAMIRTVLHREQKLLEMAAEYRTTRPEEARTDHSNRLLVRPQALILARMLLKDYWFRRSFLMDKAEPVTFPDQVREALELDEIELGAMCSYGLKVHMNYHDLLKQKYGGMYAGATFDLSPGFLAAMDRHPETEALIVKVLEQQLGSEPSIDE